MRTLALIVVAGGLIALLAVAVLGLPVNPVMGGYLFGVGWQVAVSIVLNTRSAALRDHAEYGEELAWMGAGDMDGFDVHADHMRRDRVRRHAETYVTFPAEDAA